MSMSSGSPAPTEPRTLADQLRGWSDEQVARLLRERPDLAMPAPQDSSQLAARMGNRTSVLRAVDGLTSFELAVLETAAAAGSTTSTRAVRGEADGSTGRVVEALTRLRELGLVWGSDDSLHVVSAAAAILGSGSRPAHGEGDAPPPLATAPRKRRIVDQAAAGAAHELVRHVELLLEHWGTAPPAPLRAGGLGVRDLKAAATLLHVEERTAALHVELAHAAGLLAVGYGADGDTRWLPTDAFDLWTAAPMAERWTRLAVAWLESPRMLGLLSGREEASAGARRDKPINALAPGLEVGWLPETRRAALTEMAGIETDAVLDPVSGIASLLDRLAWLRPRRPRLRAQAVRWAVDESALVGVTALGGLSSHGRELLGSDEPARSVPAVLEPLLPEPVDHVLLQADLTAVAPGPLEQQLARQLATVADIESRGGATVYRFTEASVRRAYDAGWSVRDVHDFVASASRTPVPQALSYLVDDVSRRFGTIRVGVAESFLRSDDEVALAELVHDPRAASLRLRRVAPTVVVSDMPVDVLLERLRELGTAPVVEAADGTVQLVRRESLRARTPPVRRDVRPSVRIAATVTAIRAGDRAAAARPSPALRASEPTTPAANLALLGEAVESRASVWLAYLDNHGATLERVVDPVKVEAGWLSAYDHRTEDVRSFAVHRITAVRRLP
jgi:hypothetical protein